MCLKIELFNEYFGEFLATLELYVATQCITELLANLHI